MPGLVVAFFGVLLVDLTGIMWFDGAASVVIGCILAFIAAWLARESKGLLIGESADPAVVKLVHDVVSGDDSVIAVHEVLTLHIGPNYILVNVATDFADGVASEDMVASIDRTTREIKAAHPRVRRVFVEAERR